MWKIVAALLCLSAPCHAADVSFPDFLGGCGPVGAADVRVKGACQTPRFYVEYTAAKEPDWIADDDTFDFVVSTLQSKNPVRLYGLFQGLDLPDLTVDEGHDRYPVLTIPKSGGLCLRVNVKPMVAVDLGQGFNEQPEFPQALRCFVHQQQELVTIDFFPLGPVDDRIFLLALGMAASLSHY